MFQVADLESRVLSEELEFVPLGPGQFAPGALAESIEKLSNSKWPEVAEICGGV